ncbi:MAG: hypothetical protein P1V81_12590 [Planctomycetota bacterium]|nr:hypothetical protein [Planctomycetota bacterium]
MLKSLLVLAGSLLLIAVAAGDCLAFDTHVDSERGFGAELPKGWQVHAAENPGIGHTTSFVPPWSAGEAAASVTVTKLGKDIDAEEALELKLDGIVAQGLDADHVERMQSEIAGEVTVGFGMDLTQAGVTYRLEQGLVVRDGWLYTLQRHAPKDTFDDVKDELGAVLATFTFAERSAEALAAAELAAIAERCGSEVDWAKSWSAACAQSAAEGKPILLVAWLFGPFNLPGNPRATVFMHEDVIRLVQERFVPYWLEQGEAQLTRQDGTPYGMGPNTFGQALMVVDAQGVVRAELGEASDGPVAWSFLVQSLALDEAWTGNPIPEGLSELERATLAVDRGDDRDGLSLLGDLAGHAGAYQRARFQRLSTSSAHDELLEARELVPAGAVEARVRYACELALELVYREQIPEADELLAGWLDEQLPAELRARLLHDLAGLRLVAGRSGSARELYTEVVELHPDTRWAWSAADALTSGLLDLGIAFEAERFSLESLHGSMLLQGNSPAPFGPTPGATREQARHVKAREALAQLRRFDQGTGSYFHPTERSYQASLGANPFLDATNAICGRALLAAAEADLAPVEELHAEVRLVVDTLVASVASRDEVEPVVLYMDYMTWSNGAMLELLAGAFEAGVVERAVVEPTIDELVADLAARQQANGGWSYYKKNDLAAEDVPAQSISFTTAAVSIGLSKAASAGFEVPDELRASSTRALQALRDGEGVFAYFLYGEGGAEHAPIPNPAGDVGRGPACELALFFAGASSPERLATAVDQFLDHADTYGAQQGKVLMHAGDKGEGCHYLFFDYTHAAIAAALAGGPEGPSSVGTHGDREGRRTRILELVDDCRQEGGSYMDTPINGRCYGTAMALLALLAE